MAERTTRPGEYVIVTFIRLSDGQPVVDVYTGYGPTHEGHIRALRDAEVLKSRYVGLSGPPPLVNVTLAKTTYSERGTIR